MSDKPKNPLAFPLPGITLSNGIGHPTNPGMTLRDYFAAKIAAAVWSNQAVMDGVVVTASHDRRGTEDAIARISYEQADAMLAERSRHE
jgi:hypothetical protein